MDVSFIAFGMAVLVLLMVGLMIYMSQLLKNAYHIKVELQSELTSGLQKVEDDADKKLKWIKRDIFEEIDKVKASLTVDHARRLAEAQEALDKRLQERDELLRRDRGEFIKVLERQREELKLLDQRILLLRKELRKSAVVTAEPQVEGRLDLAAETPLPHSTSNSPQQPSTTSDLSASG